MNTNTPQKLKELFETMQEDVLESHHLSSEYLTDIVNIVIGITEKCESGNDSSMDEWKGFKCIRNGLRGLIN